MINFVFILLVAIPLTLQQMERTSCHFLGVWASTLILLKMFYQLPVVHEMNWNSTCEASDFM